MEASTSPGTILPSTSTSTNLFKPIPLVFNTALFSQNNFVAVAATDINLNSQVYLLYEIPTSLLARRFDTNKNEKFKIMVIYLRIFNN